MKEFSYKFVIHFFVLYFYVLFVEHVYQTLKLMSLESLKTSSFI